MIKAQTRWVGIMALGTVAALTMAACSSSGGSKAGTGGGGGSSAPLEVAFVYNGSVTDQNWNQQGYENQQALQSKLGSKIKTSFVQNVAQGPSVTHIIQNLIDRGNKLIFMNTAGYETYVKPLAQRYPKVQFEEFEGSVSSGNYGAYNINIADADYIAGMALAAASKTGKLGAVASFPFSGIITQLNGLELGARAVNPNATLKVTFLSSFYDPAKEAQAAQSLVSSGIDGLFGDNNDANTCQVAESAHIPCVGNTLLNGSTYGPNTYLLDARFNWTPIFEQITQSVLNGKVVPTSVFMGAADGAAQVGPTGPGYNKLISKDTEAKITDKQNAMKTGSFTAYTGPISDQSGKVQVPAGQKLSADQIITIDWAVDGIVGSVKSS